jgi:hypothetical protein
MTVLGSSYISSYTQWSYGAAPAMSRQPNCQGRPDTLTLLELWLPPYCCCVQGQHPSPIQDGCGKTKASLHCQPAPVFFAHGCCDRTFPTIWSPALGRRVLHVQMGVVDGTTLVAAHHAAPSHEHPSVAPFVLCPDHQQPAQAPSHAPSSISPLP